MKLDDRNLFKRLAKPGEQFDGDWVDALHEKVRDEGVLVGEKQWNSDDPGAGADSVEVYAFEDLFFVDDDSGIHGAYETFSDDCMLLEVNNTTVRIWVDLHLNSASEEPE